MAISQDLTGFGYRLRPVSVMDAELILDLRTHAELGRFLNPTINDLSIQRSWIEEQRQRDEDYYFAIEGAHTRVEGFISLYEIRDNAGEWGRWILREGSLAAPASVLLILEFAFEVLELDQIYSRTLSQNLPVVQLHDRWRYSGRKIRLESPGHLFVVHELHKRDWPIFREELEPAANRIFERGRRS